jgi:hypothetical protein
MPYFGEQVENTALILLNSWARRISSWFYVFLFVSATFQFFKLNISISLYITNGPLRIAYSKLPTASVA